MAYVKTLFKRNFLEYASYVIKDRAIPHINDGLKPVQRRILHSLLEMDDGKFHKVANVVGHGMKYHPHGDASIYSALVVLANKEILIEKQGNFGNIFTGDEASAARYIECRILPFAKEVLHNPELTEYGASYDGRNKEPLTFPAKLPLLLVIGAEGIAVGMSTRILPHNIKEVIAAVKACLEGTSFQLFPDFPGGGIIDVADYQDGQGKVLVRAKLDTSDPKKIVVRELPFGTTTEGLINSIENASRKNKIKVASITDYTTEHVEIEIKLARGVYTEETVDALFAFTDCETSLSVNLLVIIDNKPRVMTVTEVIEHHAGQLVDVLKRELELEKRKLLDKLHARTLERIFIEERIYKHIEKMKTQKGVKDAVLKGFDPFKKEIKREITDEDIERLLKIPIRRISLYDINKARKEVEEINTRLDEIRRHLKDMKKYAIAYLDNLQSKIGSGFDRKTKIVSFDKVDVREAAQRNLKLKYDSKGGYLGYDVSGKSLFDVSGYDRILVIKKDGSYTVIDVPDKLFVGKDMRYCGLAEKDELSNVVFTALYKNNVTKHIYIKRFTIEQFILNRTYSILPGESTLINLTMRKTGTIKLIYKPKPRLKILQEEFKIPDFLVKNVKANGNRITTKDVKSIRISKK